MGLCAIAQSFPIATSIVAAATSQSLVLNDGRPGRHPGERNKTMTLSVRTALAVLFLGILSLTPVATGAAAARDNDHHAVADPYGPFPDECQIAPLSIDEMQEFAAA